MSSVKKEDTATKEVSVKQEAKAEAAIKNNLALALCSIKEILIAMLKFGGRKEILIARGYLTDSEHWLCLCISLCEPDINTDNIMPGKKLAEGCFDNPQIIKEIEDSFKIAHALLELCSFELVNKSGALLQNPYSCLMQASINMTTAVMWLRELKP